LREITRVYANGRSAWERYKNVVYDRASRMERERR
jgi:hypothetical protein